MRKVTHYVCLVLAGMVMLTVAIRAQVIFTGGTILTGRVEASPPAPVVRNLNGTGAAAKCVAAVAGPGFGAPSSTGQPSNNAPPQAACEADELHGYLAFTANTAQVISDQFTLPADWSGALNLVLEAKSSSTNAPTITVQLLCLGTQATTGGTYGSTQAVSLTPTSGSGRTVVTTALLTSSTYATNTCAVGNLVQWKLNVTAAAAADLRVIAARFTE